MSNLPESSSVRQVTRLLGGSLAAGILAGGCVLVAHDEHNSAAASKHKQASATIEARSGSAVHGKAVFTAHDGGVLVEISVEGATPGFHAVHVHETGDCSAPDGASAGGHFNPAGVNHGTPFAQPSHAGDLGNMWVGADGKGFHVLLAAGLTVDGGPSSVRGHAIIVHEKADDFMTQPTGAAGGRIGCGVIE